jgi:hypothetical protein
VHNHHLFEIAEAAPTSLVLFSPSPRHRQFQLILSQDQCWPSFQRTIYLREPRSSQDSLLPEHHRIFAHWPPIHSASLSVIQEAPHLFFVQVSHNPHPGPVPTCPWFDLWVSPVSLFSLLLAVFQHVIPLSRAVQSLTGNVFALGRMAGGCQKASVPQL